MNKILFIFLFSFQVSSQEVPSLKVKLNEADYVNSHCTGKVEFVLPDKSRVDCLTATHAIEYDWGKKWHESLGQALFYSAMTGKKAGIVLIVEPKTKDRYLTRLSNTIKNKNLNIDIWTINKDTNKKSKEISKEKSMEWFYLIIGESGAKSRILAIGLTSVVAFFLFFLNQWFLFGREKRAQIAQDTKGHRDLLIEKNEELYEAVTLYFDDVGHALSKLSGIRSFEEAKKTHQNVGFDGKGYQKSIDEIKDEFTSHIRSSYPHRHKIQMLASLYFGHYIDNDEYPLKGKDIISTIWEGDEFQWTDETIALRKKLATKIQINFNRFNRLVYDDITGLIVNKESSKQKNRN